MPRLALPKTAEESYEDVVRAVVALGFEESDAVRAYSEGRHDVDAVVNWILDHGGGAADKGDYESRPSATGRRRRRVSTLLDRAAPTSETTRPPSETTSRPAESS